MGFQLLERRGKEDAGPGDGLHGPKYANRKSTFGDRDKKSLH